MSKKSRVKQWKFDYSQGCPKELSEVTAVLHEYAIRYTFKIEDGYGIVKTSRLTYDQALNIMMALESKGLLHAGVLPTGVRDE